jgi:putative SOS response-associated peptidase YedK
MPVILEPQSSGIISWLNPYQDEWSDELQSLLRPFEGALDVFRVRKEVGKVGNNSPTFIVPLDSKENKSNIINFFNRAKES